MKERPIFFSAPMVKAILAGKKTQTRRIIKPQPRPTTDGGVCADRDDHSPFRCPYGQPGTVLWVRETWCDLRSGGFGVKCVYLADSLTTSGTEDADAQRARQDYGYKWRPSIHMPRWACRLTLRITDVRVEQVQDISEDDAKAEGVAMNYDGPYSFSQGFNHRGGFIQLWDSINAKRGYPWASNPWVWVIEFVKDSSQAE